MSIRRAAILCSEYRNKLCLEHSHIIILYVVNSAKLEASPNSMCSQNSQNAIFEQNSQKYSVKIMMDKFIGYCFWNDASGVLLLELVHQDVNANSCLFSSCDCFIRSSNDMYPILAYLMVSYLYTCRMQM